MASTWGQTISSQSLQSSRPQISALHPAKGRAKYQKETIGERYLEATASTQGLRVIGRLTGLAHARQLLGWIHAVVTWTDEGRQGAQAGARVRKREAGKNS